MALVAGLDIAQSFISLPSGGQSAHPSGSFFGPKALIIHVILLGFVGLEYFAVWIYWAGRPWARWLIIAGCFFYLTGLKGLRSQWNSSHFVAEVTVFSALLAVYLLWYLHTDRVKEWFARPVADPPTSK